MDARFIAIAIPLFFVAMGVELLVAWRRGVTVYRFADAISDLACGVLSQASGVFFAGLIFAAYSWVYGHAALFELDGVSAWIVGFLAVDFAYYWWHRATHRVALMWTTHITHHQSEDYNLAVALRQTLFGGLSAAPFYWAVAVIGVPPGIYIGCVALNTLYQFGIHTRLVGRLGPLEWVLNTPSHHRVHHGINPWSIDKNHGGVFIVFDRLFGTFAEEKHEPVYGVVEGFSSWDPLRANLEPWVKLGRSVAAARGIDRLRALFGPPEWRPGGALEIPEPTPGYRWDPPTPRRVAWAVAIWFAMVNPALLVLILRPVDGISVAITALLFASAAGWARLTTPAPAV